MLRRGFAVDGRLRALDRIGAQFAAFVQQCGGYRAEAVRGHFIGSVAQPPQTGIDDVFAHRAGAGAHGWKDVTDRPRHCLDLPGQLYSLPR